MWTALAFFVSLILRGVAIQYGWAQFVAGVFNIPELPLPAALGISTLIGLMTMDTTAYTKNVDPKYVNIVSMFASIFMSVVCLGVFWVYSLFMPR